MTITSINFLSFCTVCMHLKLPVAFIIGGRACVIQFSIKVPSNIRTLLGMWKSSQAVSRSLKVKVVIAEV